MRKIIIIFLVFKVTTTEASWEKLIHSEFKLEEFKMSKEVKSIKKDDIEVLSLAVGSYDKDGSLPDLKSTQEIFSQAYIDGSYKKIFLKKNKLNKPELILFFEEHAYTEERGGSSYSYAFPREIKIIKISKDGEVEAYTDCEDGKKCFAVTPEVCLISSKNKSQIREQIKKIDQIPSDLKKMLENFNDLLIQQRKSLNFYDEIKSSLPKPSSIRFGDSISPRKYLELCLELETAIKGSTLVTGEGAKHKKVNAR